MIFDLRSWNVLQIEILYRFRTLHKLMPPVSVACIWPGCSSSRNQRGERRPAPNILAQGFRLSKDENEVC